MSENNDKLPRQTTGKPRLSEREHTTRLSASVTQTMYKRAVRKAGIGGLSAYIRHLIERDLAGEKTPIAEQKDVGDDDAA